MQFLLRKSKDAVETAPLDLFPANPKPYKLRKKFNKSCCCEEFKELKLLITVFASELQEVPDVSGSKTLLVVST
jgi:hypothetical protein